MFRNLCLYITWFLIYPVSECIPEKGFIRDELGDCVCPPGTALNQNNECIRCLPEEGQKIEKGQCVCALEKGMIIDERGNCVCPTQFGYKLDLNGNCVLSKINSLWYS